MIGLTHLLFGLALVYVMGFPVVYGMVGAVLPDVDILSGAWFPFAHRGALHTPVAAVTLAAVLYLGTGRRDVAAATGLGVLSHLFLDTFTYSGVMWLYPRTSTYSLELIPYDSVLANLGIAAFAVLVAAGWTYRPQLAEVAPWTS